MYQQFTNLKKTAPKVKILLSVGGASNELDKKFSAIAADKKKTANFVKSALHYCKLYKFDGIDIDWETPKATDKVNQRNHEFKK